MQAKIKIYPSLLAADFGNLEAAARRAESCGADGLHIDIMDGHFVPNLSMGPDVVRMAKSCVRIPLSVHLMLSNPEKHVERFIKAGADILLIHVEAECPVATTLRRIRALGAEPGITINPETPAKKVFPFLQLVDEVLVMSVHPGYGGQQFMPSSLSKIRAVAARSIACSTPLRISVDGGIDHKSAARVAEQGGTILIVGTTLFGARDMSAAIRRIRRVAEQAGRRFPAPLFPEHAAR